MSRLGRRFWWLGGMAAVGLALWGAWQLGALNWLWEENHPYRPVVEALSWVAGIAGLILGAIALIVSLRQLQREHRTEGRATTRPATEVAGKYTVEVRDGRGVQIGDHNTQTNRFDR
ncbi:hypothetical protein [Amycolatopsis sp. cmx-4-54]|uniref:hypothetical protein n=1 Tax=Amycolatopsis sp. cmx-4-54 TaxID=2790936 RepID=UPI003979F14B